MVTINVLSILYEDRRILNTKLEELMREETFHIDGEITGESQYHCRQYIRSAAALIEGILFWTRVGAAARVDEKQIPLTEDEHLEIRELKIIGTTDESKRYAKKWLRFDDFIRNVFKWMERAAGNPNIFDPSQRWWGQLIESMEKRDKLMHPREITDLQISMMELMNMMKAVEGLENALYRYKTLDSSS